jgi:GMP synthase-like glutamine amidotransferase
VKRGIVLQHGDLGPPGVFGDWLRERGVDYEVHAAWRDPLPDVDGARFLASLGSIHSVTQEEPEWVPAEVDVVRGAVAADVPVLGLCFGGQMLAVVLGGRIEPAPEPELGWHAIESADPAVPEGPWLQWHYDRFTLPPGATQLASSPAGVQAFSHRRHLGVQFHPESTIEIVCGWAAKQRDRLRELGIDDGVAMVERGRSHARAAADAAFALFDAFAARAGVTP